MLDFAKKLILDFEKDSDRRNSAICRALTALKFHKIPCSNLFGFYVRAYVFYFIVSCDYYAGSSGSSILSVL